MGVIAPSLCKLYSVARPPIDTTRVSKAIFKHLPQPLRRHMQKIKTLGQLFKMPPLCLPQNLIVRGKGGSPIFWGGLEQLLKIPPFLW